MRKNLYFRSVFQRQSIFFTNFLGLFFILASFPRMVLEVFIRKNMGERYFRITSAILVFLFLIGIKYVSDWLRHMGIFGLIDPESNEGGFRSFSWYLFAFVFLAFSILRYSEIEQSRSKFDFLRFSHSTGESVIQNFLVKGNMGFSPRMMEIVIEPLLFFAIGIVLKLSDNSLGTLLIFCSIFYSFSYIYAYQVGDNFVLDKIDEMIINKNLSEAFTSDDPSYSKDGFKFIGRKPANPEAREEVVKAFFEDMEDDPNAQSL